jgi:hypothetical protein
MLKEQIWTRGALQDSHNTKNITINQYDPINRIGRIDIDGKLLAFCRAKDDFNNYRETLNELQLKKLFEDFEFSEYEQDYYNSTFINVKVHDRLLTLIMQGYNIKLKFEKR